MFLIIAATVGLLAVPQTPAPSLAFRVENANACVLHYTEAALSSRFEFLMIWEMTTDARGHVLRADWKNQAHRKVCRTFVDVGAMRQSLRQWKIRPAGRYLVSIPVGRFGEPPSASVTRKGTKDTVRLSPLAPCPDAER